MKSNFVYSVDVYANETRIKSIEKVDFQTMCLFISDLHDKYREEENFDSARVLMYDNSTGWVFNEEWINF